MTPHPAPPQANQKSHPLRVLAIFALGIIIPGGLLVFLGFRSLQIEGILLQRQAEDRYAALADLIQHNVNDLMENYVTGFRRYVTKPEFLSSDVHFMSEDLPKLKTLGGLNVQDVYVLDRQGHLIVPPPLQTRSESPGTQELNWGSFEEDFREAQRQEFVEKKIPEAIVAYQHLLEQVHSPALRAALMMNLASAHRKIKNYAAAEKDYRNLIHQFDQQVDVTGYPTGIVARQLLAQILDAAKQFQTARSVRLDLAERLIFNQWTVSPQQKESLLASLRADLSTSAEWQQLLELDRQQVNRRLAGENYLKTRWPDIDAQIKKMGIWESGQHIGVFRGPGPEDFAVVSPLALNPAQGYAYLAIALLDGREVSQAIQSVMKSSIQAPGLRTDIGDVQPADTPKRLHRLTPSLHPRVSRIISTIDPPYEVRLWDDSRAQESLQRRSTWIYFSLIGLSLFVLVVGLAIMAIAIRREMDAANMKADFVANVSHELRTPLAAIAYIVESLSLGRYDPEELKESFDMLGEETGHLQELIEDILDFSKMLDGRKGYTRVPQDLVELAREAEGRIQGKAKSKGFQIHGHFPSRALWAQVDRKSVVQAIMNLLDNAIKYSGSSRDIELRIREVEGWAVAEVQDHGIGISLQNQSRIFEKFYRVEEAMTRTSEGGVGLGLAMVKHIAEGHEGRIEVVSTPGEGSTFSLWFRTNEEKT